MSSGPSIRGWWFTFGVLALTAFGLGTYGYWHMFGLVDPYQNKGHDISDAIYGGLSLFVFNPPPWTSPHWTLDVARYLAPVAFSGAGLTTVYALFSERIQRLRMSRWTGHVIVCGLGYKGAEFVDRLSDANRKVAVIEANRDNPNIGLCQRRGVPVIIGNAQDLPNLRSAGISGASTLLAVCPNDAINAEIVAVARKDEATRTSRSPTFARLRSAFGRDVRRGRQELRCLAQIGDPNLCELLRVPDREGTATSSVDFFNTEEASAHLLLEKYPLDHGALAPHILVAHLDPLGRRLVLQTARKWHHKDRDQILTVSVVDDDAEARIKALIREHPAMAEVCDFHTCSTASADIRRMITSHHEAGAPPITYAYVTAYDDEQGLVTALKLHYNLEPKTITVAALSRAGGTSSLLEASGPRSFDNVHVFPTLKETCTLDLLQGGSFEPLAKAIHEVWNDDRLKNGKVPVPWDAENGEGNRESSRTQARAIPLLLRTIGCVISPLGDWSQLDFEFKHFEIETMAAAEHERWRKEKEDAGWEYHEDRDPDDKKYPLLVDFDELTEASKEINRATVRNFPKFIALAGLQVARLEPPSLTVSVIARLLSAGREYRSKVTVHATKVEGDTEWTTSHGDVLHAAAGHWWVDDGDDRWSVDGDVFRATYEELADGRFRKTATVTAVAMDEQFTLQTLEGLATGAPGDWLVRNPSGECWPVPADVFESRYEELLNQPDEPCARVDNGE